MFTALIVKMQEFKPAILTTKAKSVSDHCLADVLWETLVENRFDGVRIKDALSLYLRHYPDKREVVEQVARKFHREVWALNS